MYNDFVVLIKFQTSFYSAQLPDRTSLRRRRRRCLSFTFDVLLHVLSGTECLIRTLISN